MYVTSHHSFLPLCNCCSLCPYINICAPLSFYRLYKVALSVCFPGAKSYPAFLLACPSVSLSASGGGEPDSSTRYPPAELADLWLVALVDLLQNNPKNPSLLTPTLALITEIACHSRFSGPAPKLTPSLIFTSSSPLSLRKVVSNSGAVDIREYRHHPDLFFPPLMNIMAKTLFSTSGASLGPDCPPGLERSVVRLLLGRSDDDINRADPTSSSSGPDTVYQPSEGDSILHPSVLRMVLQLYTGRLSTSTDTADLEEVAEALIGQAQGSDEAALRRGRAAWGQKTRLLELISGLLAQNAHNALAFIRPPVHSALNAATLPEDSRHLTSLPLSLTTSKLASTGGSNHSSPLSQASQSRRGTHIGIRGGNRLSLNVPSSSRGNRPGLGRSSGPKNTSPSLKRQSMITQQSSGRLKAAEHSSTSQGDDAPSQFPWQHLLCELLRDRTGGRSSREAEEKLSEQVVNILSQVKVKTNKLFACVL